MRHEKNVIKVYTVEKGKAVFKASELGTGRKLTASRIETTWRKLHSRSETKSVHPVGKTNTKMDAPVVSVAANPVAMPMQHSDKSFADYSSWRDVRAYAW